MPGAHKTASPAQYSRGPWFTRVNTRTAWGRGEEELRECTIGPSPNSTQGRWLYAKRSLRAVCTHRHPSAPFPCGLGSRLRRAPLAIKGPQPAVGPQRLSVTSSGRQAPAMARHVACPIRSERSACTAAPSRPLRPRPPVRAAPPPRSTAPPECGRLAAQSKTHPLRDPESTQHSHTSPHAPTADVKPPVAAAVRRRSTDGHAPRHGAPSLPSPSRRPLARRLRR